jgi:hypothetical protein
LNEAAAGLLRTCQPDRAAGAGTGAGFPQSFFLDIGLIQPIADQLVEGAHLFGLPD